jgi:hypothetical protein
METKTNQNQIVITLNADEKKQKLPMGLIITLAAGTLTGVSIIFLLFMGAKLLFGL